LLFLGAFAGLLLGVTFTPQQLQIVSIVGMAVCVAVLAGATLMDRQRHRDLRPLGTAIERGNDIRSRLLNDPIQLEQAEKEVTQWRDATERLIGKHAPEWAGYFRNFSGQRHKTYDRGPLDEPLCRLDDHLERLGHILLGTTP
jgi:hypothetical protein